MGTIKLREISKGKARINFHVNISYSGGYESDVKITNIAEDGCIPEWVAEMTFDGMPPQDTPEEAIDRMGLYLREMAKAMKAKNVKPFKLDSLFKPVYTK